MAKILAPTVVPDQYPENYCCIFFQGFQTMAVCAPDGSNAVYYDITQETRLEVSGGNLCVGGNINIGTAVSPYPNYNMLSGDGLSYNYGVVIGTGDVRNYTGNPQVDFYDLGSSPITVFYNGNHLCQVKYISKNYTTFIP